MTTIENLRFSAETKVNKLLRKTFGVEGNPEHVVELSTQTVTEFCLFFGCCAAAGFLWLVFGA